MKNKIVLATLFFVFISITIFATNYYVDATNGNDGNSGTSTAKAWKTLGKVNGASFGGGDNVLFKKGEVWNGELDIWSSGNSSKQLVYSSYGTGNKPLINGQTNLASIFIRHNASYITINGFAVTNFDGSDIFDGAEGQRSGIQIGEWSYWCNSIKILNNELYYIEGFSNRTPCKTSPRGTSLDPNNYNMYSNAAIYVRADGVTTFTIDSNYVHDCTCSGINAAGFNGPSTNVLVEHNSVYNVGCDGIVVTNATSPLVQFNSCINAVNSGGVTGDWTNGFTALARGPGVLGYAGLACGGMWSAGCSDPLFQYNYCEGTREIESDGIFGDFDYGTIGGIYQYNYSRDNEGGAVEFGGAGPVGGIQIFRYNFSYNDGGANGYLGSISSGIENNNIFYNDQQQGFNMSNASTNFTNNIFYSNATTNVDYAMKGASTNNCFYGATANNTGVNAVKANPLWTGGIHTPTKIAPGVFFTINELRNAIGGFQLQAGSPCINTGHNITNNGGLDFWGNPLYNGIADIGAYEFINVTTGINNQNKQVGSVLIYPNPFNTNFNVVISPEVVLKNAMIRIYDVCGREVQRVLINSHETIIDRGELQSGIYFYCIFNNPDPDSPDSYRDESISKGKLVIQ